ncbi:MAG: hypothetical protein ACOY30_06070 [Bacillota bacterium]
MIWSKAFMVLLAFLVLMNIKITVEGIEVNGEVRQDRSANHAEIYKTVSGAVEDNGWMTCRSKEEVRSFLSRYFEGFLLDELTEKTWNFIKEPTDWYSLARVVDLKILYSDGNRAVAEAIIRIEDVDTGHNEFGKGLFAMTYKGEGWKINYVCFNWGTQSEDR